jgi:hypothetical protein
MLGQFRIKRETTRNGEEIDFLGINYAAPPIIIHETDTHLLIHIKSRRYRSGAYGYAIAPALYLLAVKVDDRTVNVVKKERPGSEWRKCKAELIAEMEIAEVRDA